MFLESHCVLMTVINNKIIIIIINVCVASEPLRSLFVLGCFSTAK